MGPALTQAPPTATQPRPSPPTAPHTTPRRPAHLTHGHAHQPTGPAPTHLLLARIQPAPPQTPTKATPPPTPSSAHTHTRFLLAGVPPHPAHDTVTSWQRTLGRRKFVRRRQRSGAEVSVALPAALPGLCCTPARWRREPGTMAVRQLRSLAGSGG